MSDEQHEHARHQEYLSLVEANNAEIARLAQREGVQIDGGAIDSGRHQFFIERLIGAMSPDDRYEFEIEWQQRVAQILKNTGRDARRRRLMASGHVPKGGAPSILHPGSMNGGKH